MKGNKKIIQTLNSLLADELTAVNQYMVHSEMAANWGYKKLHEHFEKRAIDEMKHAEKLIGRILFLEGLPTVSEYRKLKIGAEIPVQLQNDLGFENEAVKAYNEGIALCGELKDYATRELLEKILGDEDRHVDDIEALQDQIKDMTLGVFLTTQL